MISLFLALALGQDNPPPKAQTAQKRPVVTAPFGQTLPPKQVEALAGFDDIKKKYDSLMQQMMEAYQKAKTPEERDAAAEKSRETFQKESKVLAEKALALAKPQAADQKAIPVLAWILKSFPFDAQADEAAALMIKHHPQSKELFEAAQRLSSASTDWSIKVMQTVSEKAESKEDRAKAKYYLAEMYHSTAEAPAIIQGLDEKTLKTVEKAQGKAYIDRLRNADSQAMNAQAEKLLEEIVAKDAGVEMYSETLGELAKAQLFEIRHLSIGKPAPEIIGEDIDGKPMKLSDYKGKVVVLDFWGFW
jgi:hypothetical protein